MKRKPWKIRESPRKPWKVLNFFFVATLKKFLLLLKVNFLRKIGVLYHVNITEV